MDNNIFAIGGSNGVSLSSVEKYDIGTAVWSVVKSLPRAMSYITCTTHLNIIYVFHETSIYTYNTITDSWKISDTKSLELIRAGATGIVM